jgi:hypothetical protein
MQMNMKEKKSKEAVNKTLSQPENRKKENSPEKKTSEQKQKDATAGEVQYAPTIGRHGTDEEKNLNPEE